MSEFPMSSGVVLQVVAASLLGAGVSYSRLSRSFRDAPLKAVLTPPGELYVGINAIISGALLLVTLRLGWRFGVEPGSSHFVLGLARVIAAGLGAPLLLQSSFFSVRIGDVNLDPGSLVTAILTQVSQAIDRWRAASRLTRFYLKDLDFDRDCILLAELVSNALQTLDLQEARDFGERMGELSGRDDLPVPVKLRLLQFELVNQAGDRAVKAAAQCLRSIWAHEERPRKTIVLAPASDPASRPDPPSGIEALRI